MSQDVELDQSFDDERVLFRTEISHLEAEIHRLNNELRAAKEAAIDQAAERLARDLDFLSTPGKNAASLKFWASTPQAPRAGLPASPAGVNVSSILDEDTNFSLDSWSAGSPGSPMSRLLNPVARPKPFFISTPHNRQLPHMQLVPDQEHDTSELLNASPRFQFEPSPAPNRPHSALKQSQTNHPESSGTFETIKEEEEDVTPENSGQSRTWPPRTPKTPQHVHSNYQTPTDTSNTPRSFPIATRNALIDLDLHNEPPPKVITTISYVSRTKHWCEHLLSLCFLLVLIWISFTLGYAFDQFGPPEWFNVHRRHLV